MGRGLHLQRHERREGDIIHLVEIPREVELMWLNFFLRVPPQIDRGDW